jgi:hypothetical protein
MLLNANFTLARTGQKISYGLLASGFPWDADLQSIDRPDWEPTGSHRTWDRSDDDVTFRYVVAEAPIVGAHRF